MKFKRNFSNLTRIKAWMTAMKRFGQKAEVEVLSSLPLQIALHYNVCLAPFWAIGLIISLIIKMHYLSTTNVIIFSTLLFTTIIIEFIRLFLGYYGNLGEKISALSGFWVTSVILQMPIAAFSIIAGFLMIRKISRYQMARFKERVLEEDKSKNRDD
uniref:Uncharacterized protein n=1 Tax=Onchocerca volvulus TaxID=6282 RepID=A0A8R1Y888_ONCVO